MLLLYPRYKKQTHALNSPSTDPPDESPLVETTRLSFIFRQLDPSKSTTYYLNKIHVMICEMQFVGRLLSPGIVHFH